MRRWAALVTLVITAGSLLVGAPASLSAGAAARAVTSGTLTWHAPHTVDPSYGGLASVSCSSASSCRAGTAYGRVVRWDGAHWLTGSTLDAHGAAVEGMSCVSARFCAAAVVGPNDEYRPATYDGARWRLGTERPNPADLDMSCVDSGFCVLVDGSSDYQVWDGASWSAPRPLAGSFIFGAAISCASRTSCRVVHYDGTAQHFDGTSWSAPHRIDGTTELTAIDCPSVDLCTALDSRGQALRYSGGQWSDPHPMDPHGTPIELSCPTTAFCVALDTTGRSVVDQGGVWTAPHAITTSDDVAGLSCPTAAFCAAVTRSGDTLLRHPGGWSPPAGTNPAHGGIDDVTCASRALCVLGDRFGYVSAYSYGRWSAPRQLTSDHAAIESISCPSSTFCMAIAGAHDAYIRRPGGWTGPVPTASKYYVSSVSCVSAAECVAVDLNGGAEVWNGSSWSARQQVADGLGRVSCVPGRCVAVTLQGSFVQRVDGTWSQPVRVPGAVLYDVTCASATYCLGVDDFQSYRFDGRTWTKAGTVPAQPLGRVSCASSTFCVALADRAESTWDGTSWGPAGTIAPGGGLLAPSCRTDICAATTYSGQMIVAVP